MRRILLLVVFGAGALAGFSHAFHGGSWHEGRWNEGRWHGGHCTESTTVSP